MKVGDKKQATILGAVALGALAFLVIRMLPEKGARMLRLGDSSGSSSASSSVTPRDLPLTLINDPFSNPKLVGGPRQGEKPTNPGEAALKGDTKPDEIKPFSLELEPQFWGTGKKPELPKPENIDRKTMKGPLGGPIAVAEEEGSKREKIPLTLNAVMSAGNATAYIAIGAEEPKEYAVGQTLPTKPPFKVTAITDGSVTLAGDGKTAKLRVGEKKDL